MSVDLHQLRSQVHMMERTMRALRVHLEEAWQGQGAQQGRDIRRVPLVTGLERLLGGPNGLASGLPQSHEPVFPGVWFGYAGGKSGFKLEAATRIHPRLEEGALGGAGDGSSCLLATVANQEDSNGLWLTLETELEIPAVLASDSLEVRFILSFINRTPQPLGPVGLQLGLRVDESFESRFRKVFPALDVPIEMAYRLEAEQLLTLPRKGLRQMNLMMTLPVPEGGSYTAILSHFEVLLTRGKTA